MSDVYGQLLGAAIQHLEELKRCGVRFVSVSPETLAGLRAAPTRIAPRTPAALRERPLAAKEVGPFAATPGLTVAEKTPAQPRTPAVEPKPIVRNATPAAAPELCLPAEPPAAALPAPLSVEAKTAAFADLRQRALACVQCSHLASSRKHVVFGVGDINAQLMFIGEAPGADEDQQGEPFVGKAGQLLTKIIQTMGLSRDTVYIANILKCRPDTPGQSAGNRKPTPEEMQTCIPFLHEQIDLIRPKVIVALGATAVEGLLGKTVGITRLRGHWQMYRGTPLMPTYHPAYLLHKQILSEKRRVWEDMLQVMTRLGLPISEKQKRYFTAA
jgi:uracil-DNA glycosylase